MENNKYLAEINDNTVKMEELASSADKLVLEYKQKAAKARYEISQDQDLTPSAKARKAKEAVEKIGEELLEKTKALNTEYTELAVKSAVKAEFAMAESKPPQPEEVKSKLYEAEKADLQTKLLLATNGQSAEKSLNEFISKYAAEPAFAADLAANFGQLAGHIVSASDPAQAAHVKSRLQDSYNSLKLAAETAEYKAARQAHQRATTAKQERLFKEGTLNAAADIFGPRISTKLNSISID